jgi:hypothetical protein
MLDPERALRPPANATSSVVRDPQQLGTLLFGGNVSRPSAPSLRIELLLQLQKTHGNRAVQRLLQRAAPPTSEAIDATAAPQSGLTQPQPLLPQPTIAPPQAANPQSVPRTAHPQSAAENRGTSADASGPVGMAQASSTAPAPAGSVPKSVVSGNNGKGRSGAAAATPAIGAAPLQSAAASARADDSKSSSGTGAVNAASAGVDTSNPEAVLQSLASTPASLFPEALQSAEAGSAGMATRQNQDLEKSYPEIDRPAGMARGPRPTKVSTIGPSGGSANINVPAESGAVSTALPEKADVASGPVPGAEISVSTAEPAGEEQGGSWWSWLFDRLKSLVGSIPTTDPGVSTSAGPRPQTDLSGEADPAQNDSIANSGREHVENQRAQSDATSARNFGDEEVAPTVPRSRLRPRPSSGTGPLGGRFSNKKSPELPDDMRAQMDAARGPSVRAELNQQLAHHRQHQAEFEAASQKARQDGERRIAAENERARSEQIGLKEQARADVNAERERWREENRKVVQNYTDGTQAKRAETEKQINEKVQSTDKAVDEKLNEAETKATQERDKAEQEAAQKKAEVENKPHGFWESLKGAVSSFFSTIKGAITHLFQAMRQAVKRIIDEAKALVHGLIQAARRFVVGLIKAFGEFVKGAVSIALAAFPGLAKKACDWIDHRIDDAVNAVNRVADALEKAIDAILDSIGAALDAALRVLQGAFLAILDGLEALTNAFLTVMEWLAKLAEFLKKFGAFLKGLGELIKTGVEKLLAEAKKTLQQYIDRIPGKVEAFVQEQATKLGKAAAKHVAGIWRHLKPALAYLKDNWWAEVKQMVWNLVWPFNEKSPIWKDVPELIKLPGKILSSLGQGKISDAADQYLQMVQKVNSVLGVFYGWFFIASVLVGAIIGSIVPGPGTLAGAAAGAAFAGEVGEGLLIAMVATETAVIVKAVYDLVAGPGTEAVNESAYDRIANSGLTLGITDVMMILGEIAADLAKAIIDGVKGIFKGEAAEVPKVEVPKGEEPKGEAPKAREPGEPPPEYVAAEEPVEGGGKVEVTKDGECVICASPCEKLEELKVDYRDVLDDPDPAYNAARAKLDAATAETDPKLKAEKTAEAVAELKKARVRKPLTPGMKVQAMTRAGNDAAGAIRDLKEIKLRSDEVGELRADPATKKELAKLEAEVDSLERQRVELQKQAQEAAEAAKDPDLVDLAADDADKIQQKMQELKAETDRINQEIDEKLQQHREAKAKAEARKLEAQQKADEAGSTANNICDETDGTARPDATIGDGSTEAVLREEIRTGKPIKSPEGHWIKTDESIKGLERSIKELNEAKPLVDDPARAKAIDETLARANGRLAKLKAALEEWKNRGKTHPDVFNPDGSSKTTPGWP